MFAEKHMKIISLEVIPEKRLHDLCGRELVEKSHTKTFWASLG